MTSKQRREEKEYNKTKTSAVMKNARINESGSFLQMVAETDFNTEEKTTQK